VIPKRFSQAVVVVGLELAARAADAQVRDRIARGEITAGSNAERRVIDGAAERGSFPISVRPFGRFLLDSLLVLGGESATMRRLQRAPMWATLRVNTARAPAENEGPVWAGRGATLAASAGVIGQWHVVSYSFRPIAFWSQNLPYKPSKTIQKGTSNYQTPWFIAIDAPYRFGNTAYHRMDAGETYIRADTRWFATGVSNSAQVWGPARLQPLLLSNNAGGFPHAFVETGLPLNVGIGRLAGRWMTGLLAPSPFGPNGPDKKRLAIGAVISFLPSAFAGVEMGAGRFFHVYDSPGARDLTSLTLPFSGLLKNALGNLEAGVHSYNQVASMFFRVAPSASSLEAYGEYYREDHSADLRDLLVELDHQSAYMLGIRHRQNRSVGNSTLTVEASNGRTSHLARVRGEPSMHLNRDILEGHSLRGLRLGNATLLGGGSLAMLWERHAGTTGWRVLAQVARLAQNQEGGTWNGSATGYYTVAVGRDYRWAGYGWGTEVQVQPGFGDVPGTNVGLALRIKH
jgi:hypothetical protein